VRNAGDRYFFNLDVKKKKMAKGFSSLFREDPFILYILSFATGKL
jgi:hypothetical protein